MKADKTKKLSSQKSTNGSANNSRNKHYILVAALTLLGASVIQLILATSYLTAFHNPKPDNLPIGIVKGNVPTAQVNDAIKKESKGAFDTKDFANASDAEQALKTQEIFAIYSPVLPQSTITTASANGKSTSEFVASSLSKFDEGLQKQLRLQLAQNPQTAAQSQAPIIAAKSTDIAPLNSGDGGASLFYTAFSAVFGGYLAAVALNLVRGKRDFTKRNALIRSVGFAITGIVTSLVIAAVATHGVQAFPSENYWAIAGILALTYIGVAFFSSALISVMGIAGTALVIILFVILGNPASGGVVPVQLTGAGPWQWLSSILPTGASVSSMRQAIFFGGTDIMKHLWVLIAYVVIGFGILLAFGRGKSSISVYEDEIAEEVSEAQHSPKAKIGSEAGE